MLLEEKGRRLDEVNQEVNILRRRLKRGYFDQRLGEIRGDLRATWEVLGEVLRGRRVRLFVGTLSRTGWQGQKGKR